MKYLRLLSDLHMESALYKVKPLDTDHETVLVLAGDINNGQGAIEFLKEVSIQFEHVIYVLGNHEYYYQDINNVRDLLRIEVEKLGIKNVSIFDSAEAMDYDGVRFVCGTLWTDMNNNDPFSHQMVSKGLNDFIVIRSEDKRFTTQDAYLIHQETMEKFEKWVDETTIVITHHMPSEECVHSRFKNSGHINAGFRSCLDEFILRKKPRYWLHGHGHDSIRAQVGDTEIISNPRGYPRRFSMFDDVVFENTFFDDEFLIELWPNK